MANSFPFRTWHHLRNVAVDFRSGFQDSGVDVTLLFYTTVIVIVGASPTASSKRIFGARDKSGKKLSCFKREDIPVRHCIWLSIYR